MREDEGRDSSAEDPLEAAVDAFLERRRQGESPSVDEFAARFAGREEEVRELLGALELIEDVGREEGSGRDGDDAVTADGSALRRVGEYEILREVGRGGMGVVYEARQGSLGRHVALKVLPYHAVMDRRLLERFRREAKAAARLHHTNIVPVFGAGEEDGVHFYAMQFIQGQSLGAVLQEVRKLRRKDPAAGREVPEEEGSEPGTASATALHFLAHRLAAGSSTLPSSGEHGSSVSPARGSQSDSSSHPADRGASAPPRADSGWSDDRSDSDSGSFTTRYFRNVAIVGLQVASALGYAHRQGILHRDIKPSNLLLDARGLVWVTDFGLAKAEGAEDLTHTGDILGTLAFMAPERFRGWSDPRSDIYSLGITLYQMATLAPAFHDPDRARLIRKVTSEEPAPPRRVDPTVPRDLETIVLKAIEKEPARRYQSAEELADDLRAYLADRPIRARRASAVERAWRWCRRNRAVAALGGLAALLLLVTGFSLLLAHWAGRSERETRYWRHLSQARALGHASRPGRVFGCLDELRRAADLLRALPLAQDERERRRLEIRSEAIAAEARIDVQSLARWRVPVSSGPILDPRRWSAPRSLRELFDLRAWGIPVRRGSFLGFDRAARRYVMASEEGEARVCRVDGGARALALPGPGTPAYQAYFSPGGRHLALQHLHLPGHRLRVWDLGGPRLVLDLPGIVPSRPAGFGPRGEKLAVGFLDSTLRVYGIEKAREIASFELGRGEMVRKVEFSPHGESIALCLQAGPTNEVRLLDARTGQLRRRLRQPAPATGLAWHPGGALLAVSCTDSRIYLWDVVSGHRRGALAGHDAEVMDLSFDHSGDLLASRSWDSTVRLWDPFRRREVLEIHEGATQRLEFGEADDRLALPGSPDEAGGVLLDLATGRGCRTLRGHSTLAKGPFRVDVAPDSRLMASVGFDGVRLWDLARGVEVAHLPLSQRERRSAIFDPAGRWLLLDGERGLTRWPIRQERSEGKVRVELGPPEPVASAPAGSSASSTLDAAGRRLAMGVGGHGVILDLESGETVRLSRDHYGLGPVAISPGGRWVATATWGGYRVSVWSAADGAHLTDLLPDGSGRVRFGPKGRILATSGAEGCYLYESGTWSRRHFIERHSRSPLPSPLAFSPDGRWLALVDDPDRIELVDAESGRVIGSFSPPESHVAHWIEFSPDGARIVVATTGHVIQSWDLRRIRARLASLGVDWDAPPLPPAPPEDSLALEVRVDLGRFAGGPEKERCELDRQIAARPREAGLYWRRARLHRDALRWGEVIADLDRAIELEPAQPEYHHQRGHAREELGDFEGALADYSRVKALGREDPRVTLDRARAAWNLARTVEALEAWREVFGGAFPAELRARAAVGLAWLRASAEGEHRQIEEAVRLARFGALHRGGDVEAWDALGIALYRRGDWKECAEAIEKAIETRGEAAAIELFPLAVCRARQQRRAEAWRLLQSAVEWGDDHPAPLGARGAILDDLRAEAERALLPPVESEAEERGATPEVPAARSSGPP